MARPNLSRVWASDVLSQKIQPSDAKHLLGWQPEIPTYQMLNWLQNRVDLALKSLAERGVFEWGTDITYKKGALVWNEVDSFIYVALTAVTGGATPDVNTASWERSSSQISLAGILAIEAKIDAHIADTANPHGVTALQVDTYTTGDINAKIKVNTDAITAHEARVDNPHGVTAAQAGAVPVTGGTYTGLVTHTANGFILNSGNTPEVSKLDAPVAGGMRINYGTSWLGLDAAGIAKYHDGTNTYTVLTEEAYAASKLLAEPLYAVPEPSIHIPLVSDIHMYRGKDMLSYTGPALTVVGLEGTPQVHAVDEPAFQTDGMYISGGATITTGTKLHVTGIETTSINTDRTIAIDLRNMSVQAHDFGKIMSLQQGDSKLLTLGTNTDDSLYWQSVGTGGTYMKYTGHGVDTANATYVLRISGATASLFYAGAKVAEYLNVVPTAITPDNIAIGGSPNGGSPSADGNIKNIRIWNEALTDEQISTL